MNVLGTRFRDARGIVLFFMCVALLSCASTSSVLRQLIDKGQVDNAIHEGSLWLAKNEKDPDEVAERENVVLLVAEARFAKARAEDVATAYKAFQHRYRYEPLVADFVAEAYTLESKAVFRDAAEKQNSIAGYRAFWKLYPDTSETAKAKRREAELAFEEAMGLKTVVALENYLREYEPRPEAAPYVKQARTTQVEWDYRLAQERKTYGLIKTFRIKYQSWKEAEEQVAEARTNETRIAFSDAQALNTLAAFANYRAEYGDWTESQEYEPLAYDAEAGHALKKAVAAATLDALREFNKKYTRDPWPAEADKSIAGYYLRDVRASISNNIPLGDRAVERLVRLTKTVPEMVSQAADTKKGLFKLAKKHKSGSTYHLYAALHPDSRNARKAQKQAKKLYWEHAETLDKPAPWRRFTNWFPDDDRALEAERRYLWHKQLGRANRYGLQARITRHLKRSNGDIDIYVDVRDCDGQRVSGLTRDVFQIFEGSSRASIKRFWGMEDDRPLDIVFAIDLSGSMETERNAVRTAVAHFASTLSFRGRNLRLGLATFSETLFDKHNPTRNVETFLKWMGKLHAASGGQGEDGTLALLESKRMLSNSPGERIVVMMTDESLQINAGGRKRLGAKATSPCARFASAVACLQTCKDNERKGVKRKHDPFSVTQQTPLSGPGCEAPCLRRLGKEHAIVLKKCSKKRKLKHCIRDSYWSRVFSNLSKTCQDPIITRYDAETKALGEELEKKQIRPFFLVPEKCGMPHKSGFAALAEVLQGRVVKVPDNERASGPYVSALMEVADQLSRQYVIRYSPRKKAGFSANTAVVVRPIHRWSPVGPSPSSDVIALQHVGGTADCPEFTAITDASGVFRSSACGAKWSQSSTPGGEPTIGSALRHKEGFVLLSEDGKPSILADGEDVPAPLAIDASVWQVMAGKKDGLWSIGQDPAGAINVYLSNTKTKDTKVFPVAGADKAKFAKGSVLPVVLAPRAGLDLPCVLLRHNRLACRNSDDDLWTEASVKGLPKAALAGRSVPTAYRFHRRVILLSGADGAVYRSINGGTRWHRVLKPGPGLRTLSMLPSNPRLVCATSASEIRCSEDAAREFFPVGMPFGESPNGAFTYGAGGMYASYGGEVHRLYRVLNRELPSSAVYFGSNKDEPNAGMVAFLRDTAKALARRAEAKLRVEGHADKRGSSDHNEALAARRAQSVANIITNLGVSSDRLQVLSFGERQPVQKGNSKEALSRNRRVELVLVRTPPASWFENSCR